MFESWYYILRLCQFEKFYARKKKKKNPKVLNISIFCTIFTLLDSESNNNLVVKIFNNMKTNEKSMRSAQKYNCLKKKKKQQL